MPKIQSHLKGWNKHVHYCNVGGQCGQSCPCCRAEVYLKVLIRMQNGVLVRFVLKNKKKNK